MRNTTYRHVGTGQQRKDSWTGTLSEGKLKIKRNNRDILIRIDDLKDSDTVLCMVEDCDEPATALTQLIAYDKRRQDFLMPYAPLCKRHVAEMKENFSKMKEN